MVKKQQTKSCTGNKQETDSKYWELWKVVLDKKQETANEIDNDWWLQNWQMTYMTGGVEKSSLQRTCAV